MSTLPTMLGSMPIEYIVYCRKSTKDEDKQVQSIPDQIDACMKFAKTQGLVVAKKPTNFGDMYFKSQEEYLAYTDKELHDTDAYSASIYCKYHGYYVVTERESARESKKRLRRRKIISLIQTDKIRGIISYEPNRQARNMLEAGEIIDLVDKRCVDLKYVNFHFDNSSNGKMMLGMLFAFAKQYTDNQSEVVHRGNAGALARGKSLGNPKLGYIITPDGYHAPHPEYFSLAQQAFRMKLEKNISNQNIAQWLNTHGCKRWYIKTNDITGEKGYKELPINRKTLGDVRKDSFYYGRYIVGSHETDLNETNSYFQPMITQEEHQVLYTRYLDIHANKANKKVQEDHNKIFPYPTGFVVTKDNISLSPNIPSKQRYVKRREEGRTINPDAELWEYIQPHQIKYSVRSNSSSKYIGLETNAEIIDNAIVKFLDTLHLSDEIYLEYVESAKSYYTQEYEKETQERRQLQIGLNNLYAEKKKHIDKGFDKREWDSDMKKRYIEKLAEIDAKINYIDEELDKLKLEGRNKIKEFEIVLDVCSNAGDYYRKANFVQRKKIVEIFFLNVTVIQKNKLHIAIKPGMESLFIQENGPNWT